MCSWRCDDSEHQHQAGHGHHLRDGAEDKKYELFPEMDSVPMDDHQSLDELSDECLCSVHCSGRAAHSGEQNNDDLEAGIKYCPGLEPQLPIYHHHEYKPRSSRWKFTIFEPSSKYQAEEERGEFQGGEARGGIFPLAPMGVLAPVSTHAGHSSQPLSTLGGISRPICLQSCPQSSPPTPQNLYLKFQNSTTILSWIYLILANFTVKIGLIGGKGGSPIFFWIGIFQFVLLGSPCKNL